MGGLYEVHTVMALQLFSFAYMFILREEFFTILFF